MIIHLQEHSLEIKNNIRLIFKIQEHFNKPYLKVLENVISNQAQIEDQLKFLFLGYQVGGGSMTETQFIDLIIDNLGISQVVGYIEQAITELQYPGMSEQEIEAELKKKIAKIKRMSSIEIE